MLLVDIYAAPGDKPSFNDFIEALGKYVEVDDHGTITTNPGPLRDFITSVTEMAVARWGEDSVLEMLERARRDA